MFYKLSKFGSFLLILLYSNQCFAITRPLTKQEINNYKDKIVSMFYHSYESYIKYASDYDELQPISCKGMDTWGQFSLSLIDALDTLAVIGNFTEFRRVAQLVLATADFNTNINVSVFETNIRVVGGLLSAHLLSHKAGMETEPGWPCEGPLLRLAEDAARRLLPAFETNTGMPYGTVNLKYGVPENETPITCTAGVGTFILEFCTLSRLTGDPIFQKKALKAISALHKTRSKIGLVGNHINVQDGKWTATESGIGAGVDSYFEYLVKGAMLLQMPQLMDIFYENYNAINKYLKKEDWYVWVSMTSGTPTMPVFQSLEAFWPGLLTLIGEVDQAKKSLYNYHQVWKQYGFVPEFYDIPNSKLNNKRDGYPLRPEFVESVFYLYRATRDPHLLQIGADVVDSIFSSTRTECGFATVKSVYDHTIEDRMESFFLAETLKYLYLLFDETNFVHNDGSKGTIIDRKGSQCVIDSGGYVFNTEAHLIDIAAVYCCSQQKKIEDSIISDFQSNLDLYSLFGLHTKHSKPSDSLDVIRRKYYNEMSTETDVSEDSEKIVETSTESHSSNGRISQLILESDYFSEDKPDERNSDVEYDLLNGNSQESEEITENSDTNVLTPSKVENTMEPETNSEEALNSEEIKVGDSFSPTLESSLIPTSIPNVEKTEVQDFNVVGDSSLNSEQTLPISSVSESVDKTDTEDTISVEGSSILAPEVIKPTHSIEGWHSKSAEEVPKEISKETSEEFSEKLSSILSANTLVSEKISEEVIKALLETSGDAKDEYINSSTVNAIIDAFNTSSANYELLLCPSQPFLLRLSYFGQMILFNQKIV